MVGAVTTFVYLIIGYFKVVYVWLISWLKASFTLLQIHLIEMLSQFKIHFISNFKIPQIGGHWKMSLEPSPSLWKSLIDSSNLYYIPPCPCHLGISPQYGLFLYLKYTPTHILTPIFWSKIINDVMLKFYEITFSFSW